ncbi:MAG TPA: hypothetical protein PKA13_08680 [Geminicoccaceae bacterium]|nr:hypothetical protein [Geminicoccus sp.]HMU49838.1 hypothetical protein [Geminicoccaceae bacterium]
MGNRIAAVIGIVLFAAYVLFIALKIRSGAGPLIGIGVAVIAMAILDAWQSAFRDGRRG